MSRHFEKPTKRELRSLAKFFGAWTVGALAGAAFRSWWGQDIGLLIVAGVASLWLAYSYYKEAKRK